MNSGDRFAIDENTGQLRTDEAGTGNGTFFVKATDSNGNSSTIAMRNIHVNTPELPKYFNVSIPRNSITNTEILTLFGSWERGHWDGIAYNLQPRFDIRYCAKDPVGAWEIIEDVPVFDWPGGYMGIRFSGLDEETTYDLNIRARFDHQAVTGPWADMYALAAQGGYPWDPAPVPTTTELVDPVTASFTAARYAGPHGWLTAGESMPITIFLSEAAPRDFGLCLNSTIGRIDSEWVTFEKGD